MTKIYFVGGASGSGKTAILKDLRKNLSPSVAVYDFDDIGVPEDADQKWRQRSTEKWLQKLIVEDQDACLLGQIVLGEILACPSAKKIEQLNFCLLDVNDFERVQRLKKNNTQGADQNMLNWAAWLRMHHQDPQWAQHVIKEDCWEGADFSVWNRLSSWNLRCNLKLLDTTELSVIEVAKTVAEWLTEGSSGNSLESIPRTPYQLDKNAKNIFQIIDDQLFDFNKSCVPPTQEPEVINKHYVIKCNDNIVAGIHADIYMWKILYIDVLFVHDDHRHQNLGSILLRKVEEEAKAMGVALAHLDTFDWQAKDFYLKQGYEIFGVLEDCPVGHERYYLKKVL